MAEIGVSCMICSESYKNSDDIWSLDCGHVFHMHCIREWQARSAACPTCRRTTISQGRKIYLHFEENFSENDKRVLELKSQLEQSLLNASVLQQNLDDSERDFLNIQKEFSEYDERIKDLNKKNDYLTLQNESRMKDIEIKTIEIHRLEETLNASNSQGSCVILQQEINFLKEKVQYLSSELTKEMRNSTDLLRDKVQLQSMLEHATKSLKNSVERNQNNKTRSSEADKTNRTENASHRQAPRNKGCVQSVVIKNVRGTFIAEQSLINYVLKLIQRMNLALKAEDIQEASVMSRNGPENVSLLVKFTTLSSKVMFLANKIFLQQHEDTKNLIIFEYIGDNNITSLLNEAKSLKRIGYRHIYCKNNRVFVKKDDHSIAIRITNIEDIEKLKLKANNSESEELPSPSTNPTNALLEPISAVNADSGWLSFFNIRN